MTQVTRRRLLTLAGSGLVVGALPRWARAAAEDQVLFTIFLRGAADGASILHPAEGSSPARTKYESWRRTGTRVRRGIALGNGLALHPALAPLKPAIDAGHMTLVPGVGGAVFNRSHFQQQDLIESGSSTAAARQDGVLGRAWTALRGDAQGLGAVALGSRVPYSLRRLGAPSAVSVPELSRLGALTAPTHRPDPDATLRARLSRLYVPLGSCPSEGRICTSGQAAITNLDQLGALVADSTLTGKLGEDLASIIEADDARRLKLVTLDLGGWDTHDGQGTDQAGALTDRLTGLAGLLRGFYDAARNKAVFPRVTVLVMTEFGRTTFENGSQGTDHGFGGVAMVMSTRVRAPVAVGGWFPASGSGAFYDSAENENVFPRLIEHRQVIGEILSTKLGVADLSTVLPGFTLGPTRIFR